jgi:hypothetical protein
MKLEENPMSYSESRNHFEKATYNTTDPAIIDMLQGLKHLSHAIEEDIRTLAKSIRDICDTQNAKRIPSSFS